MANQLLIRLGANADDLYKVINQSERRLRRFGSKMEGIGRDLSQRVSLPLLGVGTAAVAAFAQFDKLEKSLAAVAGGSAEAERQLSRLQEVAKLPSVNLENAVQGSIRLQSVGFSAEEAEAALTQFSKAVTLAGGSADDLDAVTVQLAQINSKGRILAEDFNVIRERVPSIGLALQDAFGTQNIEAIRETGISTAEFTGKIIQAIENSDKFQAASGGLANAFDNFRQSITANLVTLGKEINATVNLEKVLNRLSGFLDGLVERFQGLTETQKRNVLIFGGVAAAIGPVLVGIGALTKVVLSTKAAIVLLGGALKTLLINPVGLTVVAIAGLVIAFKKIYESSAKFRGIIAGIGAVVKNFVRTAIDSLKSFASVFSNVIRGDFAAAGEALRDFFAKDGQSAGEAYANAFGQSLQRSAAQNFGVRGRLGGSVTRNAEESAIVNTEPDCNCDDFTPPTPPTVSEEAVREIEVNFERVRRVTELLQPDGLASDLKSLLDTGAARIREFIPVTSFIRDYYDAIADAEDRSLVFGSSFDLLGEKLNITQGALTQAIETYGVFSAEVEELKAQYVGLNEVMQANADILAANEEASNAFASAFNSASQDSIKGFRELANAALESSKKVIRAALGEAIAKYIGSAFGQFGIFGTILAAGAGAIVGGLFNTALNAIKIPALADGGLVNRPTLALIGEAGPELVTPLDKVGDVMGGGQVEFFISGTSLRGVLRRADEAAYRIS